MKLPRIISKTVAVNTVSQMAGKALTTVFGITTTALLARYLGKAGYGEYVFVIAFATMFATFADWGTQLIAVREASKRKNLAKKILGNVFILRLGLAVLAGILAGGAALILPYSGSRLALILSSLIILSLSLKSSFHMIFHTKLRLENTALMEIVSGGLILGFAYWATKTGQGVLFLIITMILANFGAGLTAFLLSRKIIVLDFKIEPSLMRTTFYESLPMGGILILFVLYSKIDTVILQGFKGSEAVGVYGLSYKIHEVLTLGAAYLMNSLLPVFSQRAKTKEFKGLFWQTGGILLLMGIVMLGLVQILAPWIIEVIGGQGYESSILALRILSLATFISYFNHLTGYSIVALGKQRYSFFIALLALMVNVLGNFWGVPRYSFLAAAGMTVVTEGLVLFLSGFVVLRALHFNDMRRRLKISP